MGRIADALAKADSERKKLRRSAEHQTEIVTARDASGIDSHVISYVDPLCIIAEQYRMLRTNLVALNSGRPIRVLVVTSAIKREGKTITVLNLATVTATDPEKRVVAVDCDLRRPKMHSYLGMDSQPGLSEILRGELGLEAALKKTRIPNLTIVPSGKLPTNPSELIGSRRMVRLIEELKERFHYVVFDTPPVMAVTDAGVLGAVADGVILVIKAESTKRDVVLRAETLLKSANARLVGCVLTHIRQYSPYYIYTGK